MNLPLEDLLDGKYEILDKIAEGGIGSIYKVRHKLLEEVRVIKVLRSQVAGRDDLQRRLMQEAKTAIQLEHPSIARLFDLAVADDGTAYIVMEFIDGVSLDSLLAATGPPSVELALEVAKQSLDALGYLHESGFIHRDISPDNLMLTRDFSDRVRVKLIDMGIAKDLARESGVTMAGTFLGKVKYCAPELFKDAGVKLLDRRSDNYSLGVTLYELVTGRHPFSGETFEELAAGHLFHAPLSFDESDPEGRVPEALRDVILRALAKDPDDRPDTAADFASSLAQFELDEEKLAEEFERTVGATTRFLSKFQTYSAGSTQDHLNEQFGFRKTGVVEDESDATPAMEPSPSQIEKTEAVLTVMPAEPATWKARARRMLRPALVLAPIAAVGAWLVLRPAAEAPPAAAATSTPLTVVERFDAEQVSDIIEAPELPSELLDEPLAVEAGAGANEPTERTPTTRVPAATAPVEPEEAVAVEKTPKTVVAQIDPDRPIELLKPGPGVVAPKLLDVLEPPYPRPEKTEIVVQVSAFVSHEGKTLTAVVRNGRSFKRRYREAAVAAVQRANFEPATRDGVPGKMWVDVEVLFKP